MALGPLAISAGTGISVETIRQAQRLNRRPSHTFSLKILPYEIQPFMMAPVIPGDSLKNLLLQARAVSDPVASPLMGWWYESYFFHVKLTDLESRDELMEMLLTNTTPTSMSGYAQPQAYKNSTAGYDFVTKCMQVIVKEYFRDSEEVTAGADTVGGYLSANGWYQAKVAMDNALQSLMLDSDMPIAEDEQLMGEGYTLPGHLTGFQAQYDAWVKMRDMQLTPASFEDWLRQYGVRPPAQEREEIHRPELLRYVREWSYPANTVGSDGSVNSQLSWSIAERADKTRYFTEPGFIVGCAVVRPKVFIKKQNTTMSAFLNDAYAWLPAVLDDQPFTSLKKFDEAANAGPVSDLAGDYWIDLKDLYLHGEQFTNIAPADLPNGMTLPDDSVVLSGIPLNLGYPSVSDVNALFKDALKKYIRVDGRVDLSIASRMRETTPA
jgi:hypothetical protein